MLFAQALPPDGKERGGEEERKGEEEEEEAVTMVKAKLRTRSCRRGRTRPA